ncbi:class I SAM-dependent methyltransferase [Faecalimonas hominis]
MSFFQNTCRPEGIGGKIVVHMMNTGHSSMAEWGFTHIKIQSEDVCLDIGCGGGANIRKLLEKSPYGRVVGIDYSEISVEKSRKINKAGIESKRCEILQGDVMKLPFRDKTFDVITAFETIYFWPDISEAFKKVYKILKIGGTFMICNESNGENPKDEKWTKIIQGMKIYNSEQIEKSLENAGFTGIKVDKTKKGWICAVVKKL